MSMILPPKELLGKIDFVSGSVELKRNVKISEKDKKLFEEYKNDIESIQKHRTF